jgi:RNA methyltransferase, TrmH family
MKLVSSRDNPDYRHLQRLARSGAARRSAGLILLDGTHLLQAYVDAFRSQPQLVVVRASCAGDADVCRWTGGTQKSLVLADRLFDALSPVDTPTGLLAVVPVPRLARVSVNGFTVFADGVQDPGNLGAILRSAAAAGGKKAVLSPDCADPWSPKCLRGGMGAQFLLQVDDHQDLPAAIGQFTGAVLAADATAKLSLFEARFEQPTAFVVGSEGRGIRPDVLARCTERVRIPMARGVESLNVAAAAALLFYEWRRRQPPQDIRKGPQQGDGG